MELQKRRVSAYCIKKGMEEIDPDEYEVSLRELLHKQLEKHKALKFILAKDKAIKYAHGRGYEFNEIYRLIKQIENGEG